MHVRLIWSIAHLQNESKNCSKHLKMFMMSRLLPLLNENIYVGVCSLHYETLILCWVLIIPTEYDLPLKYLIGVKGGISFAHVHIGLNSIFAIGFLWLYYFESSQRHIIETFKCLNVWHLPIFHETAHMTKVSWSVTSIYRNNGET